jgi:hypothetical protein
MTLLGMPISAAISAVVVSNPERAKQRTAARKIAVTRGFAQSTAPEGAAALSARCESGWPLSDWK